MRVVLSVLMPVWVAACAGPQHAGSQPTGSQHAGPIGAELQQQCPQQRPQMCTLEYAPVCALLENKQHKEFSNACSACSDSTVVGYIAGACASSAQ
jgi:hypothetical protein